ncbi:MAG: nicotinamide-nucleotide amidohydrolase family protein [Firmicutes bacterium]|nr:nicotinamide-nucleotide amidohydrolase family protein [Bacillota bacterium]
MTGTAAIVAVGDEVLAGRVTDRNGAWLVGRLAGAGVRVVSRVMVADDPAAVAAAVTWARTQAELVITTGGLGRTHDDCTVAGVARALGRAVLHREPSAGDPWPEVAFAVVAGAELWPNPAGLAPGQRVTAGDTMVVLLPGPPAELQALAEAALLPWLRESGNPGIVRVTYTCYDLAESEAARLLAPLAAGQHPRIGLYARPGRLEITLESPADPERPGRVPLAIRRLEGWLHGVCPQPLLPLGAEERPGWIVAQLIARRLRVAALESLTGGMVMAALVGVPGASAALVGGAVTYTDTAKAEMGVPVQILREFGAVSEACARAMAEVARARWNVDFGLATTGYAGPTGGDPGHPVGTVFVGCAGPAGVVVRRLQLHGDREAVREGATDAVLALLQAALAADGTPAGEDTEL